MTSGQRKSKFFVVGGPVQPNQACYVTRSADATFYTRLSEGDFCYILAPDHMGKTSLMAHTAVRLRSNGIRVAIVDLAQISSRDTADDVGRWYYSIAYRIMRELRIRSDMQTWWQERSGLTNMQRLREFFLDLVLSNTEDRIVIFIDRIGAVVGRPFARELLAAIRACHDARATEPEYQRLTFAMLGSAAVGQLVRGGHDSPFEISTEIDLPDFDATELRQLAAGLSCDQRTAGQIAERIWFWTRGHPYLSQKVLRTLARRSEKQLSETLVDKITLALFVDRGGPREEAHLMAVGKGLLRESPGKISRLALYGRIRKGRKVTADPVLDTHRDLLQSGIVIIDEAGNFALRNRVYEKAFTVHWANQNRPFGWTGLATAALAAIMVMGIPLWYTQYLPGPYIRSLTGSDQDYVTALDAYRRLHFLPGFGDTADRLFSDYLVGQSRRARRLVEVETFSERLAEVPDQQALSESLIAEFWDRAAMVSMHRGDRDTALLYALRATTIPTPERGQLVAELLGSDYRKLAGTIRTPVPLVALELDSGSGLLTSLDKEHRVEVWHVTDATPRRIQRLQLLAEEVIPLQRRLTYQGIAEGKELVLEVRTDHPRATDVLVELRAPSGRQVRLALGPESAGSAAGEYRFDSRSNGDLRALLDENVNGTWSAYFIDSIQGISGSLLEWRVTVDGKAASLPARPATSNLEPVLIPEPGVTQLANTQLAPGGRRALSWPQGPGVRGDILVWSVAGGEILTRIPRPDNFVDVRFALGQAALLITATNNLELWDIERAELLKQISIEPSLAPVLSDNGRFLVVDSVLDDLGNELAVWDLEELREIGQLVTGSLAELVATDSAGRLLAVSDGDRLVRLWSVREGTLLAEYEHGARPTSIRFDAGSQWLITQDAAHSFRLWSVESHGKPVVTRRASSDWSANISRDALLLGSLDRGFEIIGLPLGDVVGERFRHGIPVARRAPDRFVAPALLAAEQGFAVTYDGRQAAKIWKVPLLGRIDEPGGKLATTIGNDAAISRDGRQLAITTDAGDVRIVPIAEQALLLPGSVEDPGFIGHLEAVTRINFDSSGALVASGAIDGSIRVWETASGAPRDFFVNQSDGAVHDLIFSPDSKWLISASRGSVIVIDADSGELVAQTQIQSERPQLATGSDGQTIYIAGNRDGLTRWTWRGDIAESLIGPDSGLLRVAVNGDETLFVTANRQRQIQIWDAATVKPRKQSKQVAAAVDFLWLGPDGTQVFAAAGIWLYGFTVDSDGLTQQFTRLLEDAPAAVYPTDPGNGAYVLFRSHTSSPVLRHIDLTRPWPEPSDESLQQIIPGVESSLALTLNDWGEPQPLQQF
jgi:WD40 repeat protein